MKFLLFFSSVSEDLFNPGLIQEYVIKLRKFSCKISIIVVKFWLKICFSLHSLVKISNIKFEEKVVQWKPTCGMTDIMKLAVSFAFILRKYLIIHIFLIIVFLVLSTVDPVALLLFIW